MSLFIMKNDNINLIKENLGAMRLKLGQSCFHYYIGDFIVKIWTHRIQEHYSSNEEIINDCITNYKVVDINLYEWILAPNKKTRWETQINLEADCRFKDFQPIKYSEFKNLSSGIGMPIEHLCELIRYLDRLPILVLFK